MKRKLNRLFSVAFVTIAFVALSQSTARADAEYMYNSSWGGPVACKLLDFDTRTGMAFVQFPSMRISVPMDLLSKKKPCSGVNEGERATPASESQLASLTDKNSSVSNSTAFIGAEKTQNGALN
jgi:hypothetical protein